MKKLLLSLALMAMAGPALAVDCFISPYSYIAATSDGRDAQAAREPSGTPLKVTFTDTSTQSTALASTTVMVRVICTAKAHFLISADPTATTDHPYVAADTAEYFGISGAASAAGIKIAFIAGS
jgi:hypothetical protein